MAYTLVSLYFILFPSLFAITRAIFSEELAQGIAIKREEKTTHLHFYFHDIVAGKNATAIRIAGPQDSSITDFGNTMMIDDPLTEGPNLTSKLIGRAQGMYAVAAQNDMLLLMVLNYAFTEGEYDGSSISILGRNHVFDDSREMPIVGGTGAFRLASGYALAHTIHVDMVEAIVEYHVYVTHY
ncbi:dirigent protein 1-like [Mercurialis annua]|uniref:dirigent protein 1-like n=1 Tax=Mercurialis annua TaxID=3986 RepID=UPI00215F3097|nr:dirigent protein 1-like [Mercurialis annua]